MGAPFAVGQRVRAKPSERAYYRHYKKPLTGVVVGVETYGPLVSGGAPEVFIMVRRDGASRARAFNANRWEPVPLIDLTLDQTAQDLADAVKRGDTAAALALADRVFELCGGTKPA
jgi:hypothetical protein